MKTFYSLIEHLFLTQATFPHLKWHSSQTWTYFSGRICLSWNRKATKTSRLDYNNKFKTPWDSTVTFMTELVTHYLKALRGYVTAVQKQHLGNSLNICTRTSLLHQLLWHYCSKWHNISTWKRKYWQWSLVSAWEDLMIWWRSVSMSSYTRYKSLKLSLWIGIMTSFNEITFSCRRCLRSFISRRVLSASTRFSKALCIFLIATFSLVSLLMDEQTMP